MPADDHLLACAYLDEARSQWRQCHHKLRHCVDQLSDEQLWYRGGDDFNSIANLLLHLSGNIRQRMLSIIGGQDDVRERAAEFAARGPLPKAQIVDELDDVMRQTDELLARLPAKRLLEMKRYRMLRGEVENSVLAVILQTLVHLGGHTQEIIALTRRLLGARYCFLEASPGR